MNRLFHLITHPKEGLLVAMGHFCHGVSDKRYLKWVYRIVFGKKLNIDNPQTFNEKLCWLKVYYQKPLFTQLADKYRVKQIVAEKIGEEYVVPCYGKWKHVDEIDFNQLPNRAFLKSIHDSGGGILVDQTKGVNWKALHRRFNHRTMEGRNNYWHLREWPYKNIEPCIIAEEYLDEGTGHELHDYKFWCFNGKPTYMYVTNKGKVIKENFYDMDFNPVAIDHGFERTVPEYEKPENFNKMKELAAILSKDIPFVRIDFFNVNGHLYFGEFTFYDWGGMRPFRNGWDEILGEKLVLPVG